MEGHTVVLDVGKTLSKVTLWTSDGTCVAQRTRTNNQVRHQNRATLDVAGIEAWLADVLADFAKEVHIGAIVPVAHGAAVAVIRDGKLHRSPSDYEEPIPAEARNSYERLRDAFVITGSPALPDGLNVGVQLHVLQERDPGALTPGSLIVTWPQYWAWLLSGVPACEVSSLGCHTDLWVPTINKPSPMAVSRGWAELLAPLRRAEECLGHITPEWTARTGLPSDVRIYCGLHDSNAALVAARGFAELGDRESTVLSTGTWFVAMRSPARGTRLHLDEWAGQLDCLVNVDPSGQPVPSARFMGGREIERLIDKDTGRLDGEPYQPALRNAILPLLDSGAMAVPTFAPGCGPFPNSPGRWINRPVHETERRAAIGLYAALVADASLDLIGSRERLLIEGRFSAAPLFVRTLAALRVDSAVFVTNAHSDVSYGALRTIRPDLAPQCSLVQVQPVDIDLNDYRNAWRAAAQREARA